MKILLLSLAIVLSLNTSFSQTCEDRVYYDEMESFTWFGDWFIGSTSGFSTAASVSPTLSAFFYGVGGGSSAYEGDWYVLPNVSGLNSTSTYIFRFRLASYRFTSTSSTRGVDAGDYITVQLSTDGGFNYTNELRVTGNNNAYWSYSSTAIASKTANGTLTIFSPTAGGDRTSTGDGYSFIELILPPGTTQCAIDIFCRANGSGEEWWIDDIELIEQYICSPLPITLMTFDAFQYTSNSVKVNWTTASEQNNDYFIIENSIDGYTWKQAGVVNGAGNSNQVLNYSFIDYSPYLGLSYYRLTQVDFDGQSETFDPKAVNLETPLPCNETTEYYDLTGRKIEFSKLEVGGIYLKICGENIEKITIPSK
jgi:hypothetical protein